MPSAPRRRHEVSPAIQAWRRAPAGEKVEVEGWLLGAMQAVTRSHIRDSPAVRRAIPADARTYQLLDPLCQRPHLALGQASTQTRHPGRHWRMVDARGSLPHRRRASRLAADPQRDAPCAPLLQDHALDRLDQRAGDRSHLPRRHCPHGYVFPVGRRGPPRLPDAAQLSVGPAGGGDVVQ